MLLPAPYTYTYSWGRESANMTHTGSWGTEQNVKPPLVLGNVLKQGKWNHHHHSVFPGFSPMSGF